MKSYHFTVWGILLLFGIIMIGVTFTSFTCKSQRCKMDPAQIQKVREQAST